LEESVFGGSTLERRWSTNPRTQAATRNPDMAKRMTYFREFAVVAGFEELGSGTGRGFLSLCFFFDI
jgi:hypothetical protein